MKKISLIFASIIACLILVGCNNNNSNQSNSSSNDSFHFNQEATLKNGNQEVKMTITKVQQVNPEDDSVVDVSHNYKETHQYVVVTYKVTAVSDKVKLSDFDGYNVHVYDSKNESAITSSNRTGVLPDTLSKGQTQVMEVGYGLRNKSSKVTAKFANESWSGPIQH